MNLRYFRWPCCLAVFVLCSLGCNSSNGGEIQTSPIYLGWLKPLTELDPAHYEMHIVCLEAPAENGLGHSAGWDSTIVDISAVADTIWQIIDVPFPSKYEYRVKAHFADGTSTVYSPFFPVTPEYNLIHD